MKVATVAIKMATNSRGCSPITAAKRPAVSSVVSLREDRLGTFLHLIIGNNWNFTGPFGHQLDRIGGARTIALDRQTHGDARALAEAAADVDLAAVQADEALDDRQAETRPVLAAVIRCIGLEEGLAQARQVGLADADAVILDGDREIRPIAQRADGNGAATLGELDGVGNEVDQDLVEGAAVGRNVGQAVREANFKINAGIARLERQQVRAAFDGRGGR